MPQSPNPNVPPGVNPDPIPVRPLPPVGNENQLTPTGGLPPGAISTAIPLNLISGFHDGSNPPGTVSSPTRSVPPFGGSVKANTSGVWISVKDKGDKAKSNLTGINTNQVNWGTPYKPDNPQERQSAYQFDGLTPATLTLDGKDCLLGTFTHFNYTITGDYSISQAILKLTIQIQGVGTKEFNVTFNHNETPNKPGPVPDKVSIPEISATQEVTIQGKAYALTITGFLQNEKVTRNFITEESKDNKAEIYCKLVLIEEPVQPVSPPVTPTCYLIVLPSCPCPPPQPPVSPIFVIYPPTGVIPGGQTGPTVIPGGQIGPTVIPGGQIGPTVIPGGQIGPTVIPGGQTGPTVIPGRQIGPTVIPGGQTGPTVIPGRQIGPTIIPGQQTGPTVIPGRQIGPTIIPGQQTGPTVIPGRQIGPTIIPGQQTGPTVIPGRQIGPTIIPGQQTGPTVIPGRQIGPTIIPGQQTGPTVIPGRQIGPTIIPGQQTGPTVIPGQQTGPTVIQGGQTGTTITQQTSFITFSISSFGIWLNVVEELAGYAYLTGIGTNQISWGISTGQGGQSSYFFQGITTTSISLDGSYFTLGTFTHYNYPVTGYSIRSATLQLTVNINGVEVNFSFQFNHNETPNAGSNGTCPLTPGFPPPCPDIVSISNSYSQELITINEKQYALCVVGFIQNNQIESQFITFENQVNVAELLCQFVEVNNPSAPAAA
ncbi:choice-of-anchor K domain-containing protein [Lyngbya sp. PCC 8106]|uniref:choice-of-anchor K domain-containing protein n=1 Tax=Lyngbya sp. (strain PCC 8106) TaxID=313612 RepID=UPI0000EAAFDF|nr:choice-of-anchor K domain-containing protein [Lyngbya sp. PCC 8106]EAW39242.1 hypothetical protein L8106_04851 [Lyngbya sp. PCC 8106]